MDNQFFFSSFFFTFPPLEKRLPPLPSPTWLELDAVCMQECLNVFVRIETRKKKESILIFVLRLFPRLWQLKRGRWSVSYYYYYWLLLWLSELWLLSLMFLRLIMITMIIIIKCWMLSFIVCVRVCFLFLLVFYILYKEKKRAFLHCLVVDSKPWGFYRPSIVPVYAFYVVLAFFTDQWEKKTSLSNLGARFKRLVDGRFTHRWCTNWLKPTKKTNKQTKQSSRFVNIKCFSFTVCVCRCFIIYWFRFLTIIFDFCP